LSGSALRPPFLRLSRTVGRQLRQVLESQGRRDNGELQAASAVDFSILQADVTLRQER
jgi:hypothetical protein